MKRTLTLVLVLATAVVGCRDDGDEASPETGTAGTSAESTAERVAVPDVAGMALPDAVAALDAIGLASEATDAVEGRVIVARGNWYVLTQEPEAGAEVPAETVVALGVHNVSDGEGVTKTTTTEATIDWYAEMETCFADPVWEEGGCPSFPGVSSIEQVGDFLIIEAHPDVALQACNDVKGFLGWEGKVDVLDAAVGGRVAGTPRFETFPCEVG